MKAVQNWALVSALLYFAPTPWQWIGSVPGALYSPMRLFWSAAEGRPEWWLILPGLILQVAAAALAVAPLPAHRLRLSGVQAVAGLATTAPDRVPTGQAEIPPCSRAPPAPRSGPTSASL